MKLKIKDLRKIIKEAVKEHGLDGFRKSEGFKAQLEAIMNTLSEFSSKTPVGFFDAYNKEFDVDFYKTFHDFHETTSEAYSNLYGSPGASEVHVGNVKPAQTAEEGEEDTANVEQKIGESKEDGDRLTRDDMNYGTAIRCKEHPEWGNFIVKDHYYDNTWNIARGGSQRTLDFAEAEKHWELASKDVLESKVYGGAEPDLDSWSKKKIEDYWDTFKKNYKSEEAKLSAASTFTSNPEQFLLDLEARATKVKEDRE